MSKVTKTVLKIGAIFKCLGYKLRFNSKLIGIWPFWYVDENQIEKGAYAKYV